MSRDRCNLFLFFLISHKIIKSLKYFFCQSAICSLHPDFSTDSAERYFREAFPKALHCFCNFFTIRAWVPRPPGSCQKPALPGFMSMHWVGRLHSSEAPTKFLGPGSFPCSCKYPCGGDVASQWAMLWLNITSHSNTNHSDGCSLTEGHSRSRQAWCENLRWGTLLCPKKRCPDSTLQTILPPCILKQGGEGEGEEDKA